MTVTIFQLKSAAEGYALVAREAETLRIQRNALIRGAAGTGLTHQQISDVTGLSRGRINQIINEQDRAER